MKIQLNYIELIYKFPLNYIDLKNYKLKIYNF